MMALRIIAAFGVIVLGGHYAWSLQDRAGGTILYPIGFTAGMACGIILFYHL